MNAHRPPSIVESLGLRPLPERLRQTVIALRGAPDLPPTRFGLSSLSMLNPRLSLPLWLGRFVVPRTVLLTNLFNRRQTPIEEGWSVRRTQAEDFRGRALTYDSHNGTDLCVPRGTLAVAPAPGRVARVYSEFNRGGNKVVIDHGRGLMTCSAHLARPLVREGDPLDLGQPYALTGYSGLDGLATFPWGVPHIHFNVWLNGEPVDPFARAGEESLWLGGAPSPVPAAPASTPATATERPPFEETAYDRERVDEVIAACKDDATRARLATVEPLARRAEQLVSELCYYPTRFCQPRCVQTRRYARRGRLHLPFRERDFDGVVFLDELRLFGLVRP